MTDEKLRKSQAQEKRGMKRLGGTVQPQSGAGWAKKGDGRTKREAVEFKRTDKKQITLKAVDLQKITTEALVEGREALLGFEVGGRHYVVLTEDLYDELRWMAHGESQSNTDQGHVREKGLEGASRLQGRRSEPVLPGLSSGADGGEGGVPSVPGDEGVPGVRPRQLSNGRSVRGVGRSLRAGAQTHSEEAS